MARVALTVQDVGFQGSLNPIVWTAADATNDHTLLNEAGSGVLLMAKNDDAAPHTVTAVGVADRWGHSVDLAVTVAAGAIAILGPFAAECFNQSGSLVNVDIDTDTSFSLAAVRPAARR